MDIGLLIIRVVVGALLVGHGAQKLFGWFGGHGLQGTGGFFESLGYRPGRAWALLAGVAEAGGGLLLGVGLLTPLAAIAIVGLMLNVILSAHWGKGPWASNGGYEYPLVLTAVAVLVAFTGSGRYGLDHLAGWQLNGAGWGLTATALGLAAGLVAAAVRLRALGAHRPVQTA